MNELQKAGYIDSIFSIPIFVTRREELLDFLFSLLKKREEHDPFIIFTPNPEQISLALQDSIFQKTLSSSSINLPDGHGLVWALNRKMPSSKVKAVRVAGREVFHDLLVHAAKENATVYLLGGNLGSGEEVITQYENMSSALPWVTNRGYENIRVPTHQEESEVTASILHVKPELLFVAFGAPFQENWVLEHRELLKKAKVKIVMVVGGSYEYEAGKVPKVSHLVETLHLEWLQRLLFEPWRWKRQMRGLRFFVEVLRRSIY